MQLLNGIGKRFLQRSLLFCQLSVFAILFYSGSANAQSHSSDAIGKIFITDACTNGEDHTNLLMEFGAYAIFYTDSDGQGLNMANVWPGRETQSYGWLEKLDMGFDLSDPSVNTTHSFYHWHFINSYDPVYGVALVEIVKELRPGNTIWVTLCITAPNGNDIVYSGYLDGRIGR